MKTTGKITTKLYRCKKCGFEERHATNHYGDIYNIRCKGDCALGSPLDFFQAFECLDPIPDGWGVPEPWVEVRLGDIVEVIE